MEMRYFHPDLRIASTQLCNSPKPVVLAKDQIVSQSLLIPVLKPYALMPKCCTSAYEHVHTACRTRLARAPTRRACAPVVLTLKTRLYLRYAYIHGVLYLPGHAFTLS